MNATKAMTLLAAAFAILAQTIEAAVGVTVDKTAQRYPWNGLVDIDYTVACDADDADVYVFPEGRDNDRGITRQMRTLTGEGANAPVKPGKHRMTWNALADMPNFHSSSFAVKMSAMRGAAPYIVIDLSGGSTAANYPVRYSITGPDLANDACRTTNLWLRLILPGTFTMGSPTTELGRSSNETQHKVTLTKPFYMGVFQLTQKQWLLVTGDSGSGIYPKSYVYPQSYVSYKQIRGSNLGAGWPSHNQVDANSFLGKMRVRTSLTLDLPTEAQWEYACRAGTTTALNNGRDLTSTSSDAAMDEVGRYYYNGGSLATVGQYKPNAWGLYDMHGNVWEWCLDWHGSYSTGDQSDPMGAASGKSRVLRGGCCNYSQTPSCRSASRNCAGPQYDSINGYWVGIRLCCSTGL